MLQIQRFHRLRVQTSEDHVRIDHDSRMACQPLFVRGCAFHVSSYVASATEGNVGNHTPLLHKTASLQHHSLHLQSATGFDIAVPLMRLHV